MASRSAQNSVHHSTMSLRSRRAPTLCHLCLLTRQSRRHASTGTKRPNPLIAKVLNEQRRAREASRSADRDQKTENGGLASNSIVNRVSKPQSSSLIPPTRAENLDPKPAQRRRWERKKVIQDIRKRGRLTRAQFLKRMERELVCRSGYWRTSMKKLNPLAKQISGKTVEDAIVQMRFSKKKAAQMVSKHLEAARDRAVVERGMGLGKVRARQEKEDEEGCELADEDAEDDKPRSPTEAPLKIQLKDGKQHKVADRTGMYIAQAWVGKGPYTKAGNPRAFGRVDVLRLPLTSISVLLKEEATRIREHEERKRKDANRKIWMPLPDRPITAQRQYYCW